MTMKHDTNGPVTYYVRDTTKWEKWMLEYQFGALYIFPPSPLREKVNALRARLDPKSQSYCDAHISLTVPLPRPLTARDLVELEATSRLLRPIDITYGPVTSYPGHAGVVLKIEPREALVDLVQRLESLPCFVEGNPRTYPFSPHMTIAEFITIDRTNELVQELSTENLAGTFRALHVSYAVPNQDFHFEERDLIVLGEGSN